MQSSSVDTAPCGSQAPLSPVQLAAWAGFLRTNAALLRALDSDLIRAHSLPLSSYEVLLKLAKQEDGAMRMSDLADAVLLSRSGVTRLVDRLERDGLLERRACTEDARGSFAVLTERGRESFEEAQQTHLAGVRRLFLDRLDDSRLDDLAQAWRELGTGV